MRVYFSRSQPLLNQRILETSNDLTGGAFLLLWLEPFAFYVFLFISFPPFPPVPF